VYIWESRIDQWMAVHCGWRLTLKGANRSARRNAHRWAAAQLPDPLVDCGEVDAAGVNSDVDEGAWITTSRGGGLD
jgi:hypothetical protein